MLAPQALLLDLVEWVAAQPRAYNEVMAHWRTSCPHLPVWEDAVDAGLVRCELRDGQSMVTATEDGRRFLANGRR